MAFVLNAKLNLLAPNNVAIIANQIRKELNSVSSVGLNVVAPTNMKSIVGQINADLKKVNRNIRINVNAKTMTTSIEKIKQATSATEKLSKSVEGLGFQTARSIRHYAGFALTTSSVIKLAAAFSAGVGDAVKYDRELVRISQVTGQSLSGLKDLSREVTRLSTSFGVSSEKILESAVTLSQAGLSAKDTKVALEALAKTGLSATFGDITGTTEAAIAIMQQFGYQAKDLEGILGSVNAVSAAFAVESEDIAVAVRRSGGALQAAGVNFHEFGALLTSVRQTTRESAESIATGFRTIFARLQRSRTQDFLKNLGIDVLNDDGLFVGGYEAIKRISAALKEVSTVDPRFSQIVEELGGFRQVSKVIPLIEKFDVAEKALNVSLRGGNSLTKDAATAQQSLEVQFTKTREAFLALVRDIINEDSFKTLIRGTLEVANAFIKVGDSIKDIIPLLGLIGLASFIPKAPSYKTGFIKGLFGNNKTEKFASGGYVPGSGNGDTVPALLTPGEFVIKKSSAKAIGYDKLNQMNKYASGGKVGLRNRKLGPLKTNLVNIYEPISNDENKSINDYGSMGFYQINGLLRGNVAKRSGPGVELSISKENFIRRVNDIKNIDKIITKSVINRDTTLYRGIGNKRLKAIEESIGTRLDSPDAVGRIFVDKGFVSTSRDKNVGRRFGELFYINVKKGQRATTVIPHGDTSEQEILLPRNSAFKVIRKRLLELVNPVFPVPPINSKQSEAQSRFGKIVRRNSGGTIPGQGDSDSVPSLLTPGEFVINKKAAKNIGYATLNNMNRQGKVKKYNKGGLVGNIVSRVKDNPLGALTLVTAGATTLANMIGDTNSALSELTQTALNAAVQFGIASTVLTKGGDLLSRQLTAHPEIDKYTKTGKQNAANNIKNADISYMPEVQAYRKRATEKMAKSFTDRADYQQTGRTHKEDLQEFDNESHFKANKAARQFAGLREKDLFTQGFNPKDPDIQAETNRLAELKRQAVFKRESGKTRTEIKTVSRYRKASPQEDGNNHFNAQIESSKFYMAHEDRLKAQGVDTNDPKVRDELERLSALKQKAAYKRATRKSEFYTTTERKQVSRQGIVNDYKKRLANTASELSANPGAQYMIDEDVKGFSNSIKNSDEFKPKIERRLAAENKLNNIKRLKMFRGTAIGGAIAGVAGNIGGQYLQNRGSEEIANGSTSTVKSTTGGAISGAASYGALGAQVGAIGGPWGIAIGAGVGAIVGALKGGADALAEAEKQIRAVKLDKDLVNLGRKLNAIANGTSSARGSSMDVTASISSAFKDISSLSGNERTDAISKFKNNNAAIESFYTEIAKNSSSLEDFNKVTGNSLIQFAAISDIGFTELVTSVNSTIKAEIKAKEALDKMSAAAAITADSQAVLEAFVTAIASASSSLDTFDRNLDRIEAGLSFSGANLKSQSAGTIFKAAAGGRFTDANKVADISSNLTSQFGSVGQVVAKQTGDIAKARQLIPEVIKEFANSPFSEDRTPQSLAEKKLKGAGISDGVIQQVLAGITNTIGNESNQANLAKKFAANPNDTANDIFKTLTPTIEAMGDFANKISEHNNRIGRLFDISSKIQSKINSMQLEQESKLTDLLIKIKEDNGGTLSLGAAQNLDKQKVAAISGTPGIAVNSNTLFNRASTAKSNIKSLDEIISQKELDGLNVDAEIQARQENIDVLTKSSAALEEMTKNGYEYAAIEKALSKASNERRFRKDALNLQTFGSKADKDKEAKTIATVLALKNKQIKVGQLNDEGKAAVSAFLEQNSEVQFKGLGGQKGEDFRKELIIQDQMEKLQKYSGLSPAEAEKKAKENVEQGFSKTKEEGRLQEQLINLVKGQGEASNALQKLLAQDDPLKTNMLAEENSRFLSELGSILTQNLVNQETVKKEQAQGVLDKAKNAASLPKIEDIQNAQAVSQINSEVKTKTDSILVAKDEKLKSLNSGLEEIRNNKNYQGPNGKLNMEGEKAARQLSKKILGNDYQDKVYDAQYGKEIYTDYSSVDAASKTTRNRLIETTNLELNNSVNPIIDRRKGLRPVDPSLQGKTPAELQDMLDRKKAAPSEAEVRGARNQVDTSNRSIRALEAGMPVASTGQPQQSLVQRAMGASQGFDTGGVAKAKELGRSIHGMVPNLGDINLGNGLTASSISEKIRQSQSKPSLVQRAMSATQGLDTGSVSKVNEIKDGLVGIMNSSVNGLNSFASNFNSTIEKLSGLEMNLNGNHKVEIVFNGAEMLGKLTPEIEAMVVNKTKEALNKFASDNFPNIPRQV